MFNIELFFKTLEIRKNKLYFKHSDLALPLLKYKVQKNHSELQEYASIKDKSTVSTIKVDLVEQVGFEPTTFCVSNSCSTTEL